MKKRTSAFIALILLLSLLITSCTSGKSEQSIAETSQNSESTAEPSAEESTESPDVSAEERSEGPETFTYRTPVTVGCVYTTSKPAGDSYPDSHGIELTDGIRCEREGAAYSDPRLAGYGIGEYNILAVTVDLGAKVDRLYAFELDYLDIDVSGISAPYSLGIAVSDDGSTFTTIGSRKIKGDGSASCETCVIELEKSVSARYVRFNVTTGNFWGFIDEVTAFADVAPERSADDFALAVKEAYKNAGMTEKELASSVDKIITGTPDRTLNRFDAIRGKRYSSSARSESAFTDPDNKLTDGSKGIGTENDTWVAYKCTKGLDITFDIGAERTDVAAFSLHAASLDVLDIGFPTYVSFAVSSNAGDWNDVGVVYAPTSGDDSVYDYVIELPVTVKARYVRVSLPSSELCKMYLIDEVGVYAYCGETNEAGTYPPVEFPKVETDVYWDKNSFGYGEKTNLLLGLPVYASSLTTPADMAENGSNGIGVLTDGKRASDNDIHNGEFFECHRGNGRELYFDIGKLSALSEFTSEFADLDSWGVDAPSSVNVRLSADGEKWFDVGNISIKTDTDFITSGKLTLDKAVKARFVCFAFDVNIWTGVSELEAFGTKSVENAIPLDEAGFKLYSEGGVGGKWASPSPDVLGGVHDVFLAYHSKTDDFSVETLMNVIGYTDKDGTTVDTLFDGVLFLMSGGFPSNSDGNTGSSNRYDKSDVDWLMEHIFADDKNLGALDTAVGKLKNGLSLNADYKVKYFLSLYTPNSSDFGDVDGDGKSETSSTNDGMKKIAGYLIDTYYKELSEHKYENVEFGGFYWYNEGITEGLKPVVSFVTEKVHENGSQVFWIPYYQAAGYTDWKNVGIDVACLQPNYAFSDDVPRSRLTDAARIAKKYGMCIELEMDYLAGGLGTASTQRYFDYLASGAELGYMTDAIHFYYIGLKNFDGEAYRSDTGRRLMYDYTYRFIKGTLKLRPDTIADASVRTEKDTPVVIDLINDASNKFFKVGVSPAHGSVTVTNDGKAVYYPASGFTGEDVFTFTYSERLDYSEDCRVVVNVG